MDPATIALNVKLIHIHKPHQPIHIRSHHLPQPRIHIQYRSTRIHTRIHLQHHHRSLKIHIQHQPFHLIQLQLLTPHLDQIWDNVRFSGVRQGFGGVRLGEFQVALVNKALQGNLGHLVQMEEMVLMVVQVIKVKMAEVDSQLVDQLDMHSGLDATVHRHWQVWMYSMISDLNVMEKLAKCRS